MQRGSEISMLSQRLARQLEQALRGLDYGSLQLVIHEGQVVRIERIERIRLPAAADAAQAGLTVSPEAPSSHAGEPTTPTEARHDER